MHNDDTEHVLYVNNCLFCVYFHLSQETAGEPSWTKSPAKLKKKLYKHNNHNLVDQVHCYLCLAHPLSYCPKRMKGVGKKSWYFIHKESAQQCGLRIVSVEVWLVLLGLWADVLLLSKSCFFIAVGITDPCPLPQSWLCVYAGGGGASSSAPDNGCRWPSGWGECGVGKDRHLQEGVGESATFHFGKLCILGSWNNPKLVMETDSTVGIN